MFSIEFRDLGPDEMFNLREVDAEQLGRAAEKLHTSIMTKGPMKVHRRSTELLEQAVVESGDKLYEVIWMGLMVSCSCPNWELGHKACKHIALALPPYCRSCFVTPAVELLGLCALCGPGNMLPVGTRFTVHKIFGKMPLFEVVEIDDRGRCIALDTTLPRWNDDDAPKTELRLDVLDSYRSRGLLKIVYKPLDI